MSDPSDPSTSPESPSPRRTEEPSDERRRYERHSVEALRGVFLFTTEAAVVNISLDGVAVETRSHLKVGRTYSLKLGQGGDALALRGKVVWCSLVRTAKDRGEDVHPVYRAGIHFEEILSERATQVYEFIEKNAVVSLEKRLFGRFRLHPARQAAFDYEVAFTLRRLSLAGALIEADFVPEVDSTFEMEIAFDDRKLYTIGRVAYVRRLGDGGERRAEIGVEFVDLGESSRDRLEEFIRTELG